MKSIYLPNPNKPEIQTLGEHWFITTKFWKLFVMFGYDWTSSVWVKTGFSFTAIRYEGCPLDKKIQSILDYLDNKKIKYRTEYSNARWQYKIIISTKKSVLEQIDKDYAEFYKEKIKECVGMYVDGNEFLDKEKYLELQNLHKEYYNEDDFMLDKFEL